MPVFIDAFHWHLGFLSPPGIQWSGCPWDLIRSHWHPQMWTYCIWGLYVKCIHRISSMIDSCRSDRWDSSWWEWCSWVPLCQYSQAFHLSSHNSRWFCHDTRFGSTEVWSEVDPSCHRTCCQWDRAFWSIYSRSSRWRCLVQSTGEWRSSSKVAVLLTFGFVESIDQSASTSQIWCSNQRCRELSNSCYVTNFK